MRWQEVAIQGAVVLAAAAALLATAPAATPPAPMPIGQATTVGAAAVPLAADLDAQCRGSPVGVVECVQAALELVLMDHGDEVTFALLGNVTALDETVQREQHNIAHHLGRVSLDHYPDTQEALRHCPVTMASGCFHGALERHFSDRGPPRNATDVSLLCSPADGPNRQFQCLHGLGHGLDMVAHHDLPVALAWCDLFAGSWEQESCGGGVFMENIQGDTTMEHSHGDEPAVNVTWVRMKADDILYPCNVVEPRWWHACYWLQSSLYLKLGFDWARAFAACDQAPVPYDGICYESMGRDISGADLRNGPKVVQDCQMGNATRLPRCIFGAVQEFVNNVGDPTPGFAFCPTVPWNAKTDCYRGVGIMVQSLYPDKAERATQCDRSEPAFVPQCRYGAGLPTS